MSYHRFIGLFSITALLVVVTGAFSVTVALLTKEIATFASIVSGISLPVLLLQGCYYL